jgi:hypothetical protein
MYSVLLSDNGLMLPADANPLDMYPFLCRQGPQSYSEAFSDTMCADIYNSYANGHCNPVRGCSENPNEIYFSPKWLKIVTSNRRIFRTPHGYYGIAPKTAKLRDKVCVLLGGKVPYIIREEPQQHGSRKPSGHTELVFPFISDAFAHGLMDGQAITQVKAGKIRQECIILGGRALTLSDMESENNQAHMIGVEYTSVKIARLKLHPKISMVLARKLILRYANNLHYAIVLTPHAPL